MRVNSVVTRERVEIFRVPCELLLSLLTSQTPARMPLAKYRKSLSAGCGEQGLTALSHTGQPKPSLLVCVTVPMPVWVRLGRKCYSLCRIGAEFPRGSNGVTGVELSLFLCSPTLPNTEKRRAGRIHLFPHKWLGGAAGSWKTREGTYPPTLNSVGHLHSHLGRRRLPGGAFTGAPILPSTSALSFLTVGTAALVFTYANASYTSYRIHPLWHFHLHVHLHFHSCFSLHPKLPAHPNNTITRYLPPSLAYE